MESYVGKKLYQRWLWQAIDQKTRTILAFVLGRRQDLQTAKRIFESSIVTRRDLRRDYNEIRYVSIGIVDEITIIVVVHTNRESRTQLISARPASRRERKTYYEQIQKTDDSI